MGKLPHSFSSYATFENKPGAYYPHYIVHCNSRNVGYTLGKGFLKKIKICQEIICHAKLFFSKTQLNCHQIRGLTPLGSELHYYSYSLAEKGKKGPEVEVEYVQTFIAVYCSLHSKQKVSRTSQEKHATPIC